MDVPCGCVYRRSARYRLFPARSALQRCCRGCPCFFDELPDSPLPRAWRRRPRFSMDCGVDTQPSFCCDRSLSLVSARFQSRSRPFPSFHRPTYSCAMNPLPDAWVIKHRANACAVTRRPFVPGEYFYTLLFHESDGYRREDLCEEAWQNRNQNIRPFSFWKSRYEPLPPKLVEPLPKENAEQLFRRLMASASPPANACYVLAAMLERKRVLKQITERNENGRV